MNKLKRLGAVLLSLCLLFAAWGTPCLAAEYTYTVTLYAGNHASFSDGSDTMTFTGLREGELVSFGSVLSGGIQLDDGSKYYVKGVRLSGRDNNTVSATAFPVTGDAMYVVAYGIQGEMTSYTVNYLDENGTALGESQSYYGNVGDKPVVAFLYVEGYQPQAYNLTKTLSANAAENVFNFVYTPVEAGTPAPTPTASPAPTTEPGQEDDDTVGPAGPGGQEDDANTPPNDDNAAGPAGVNTPNTDENGVPYVEDLDDNDVPLANGPGADQNGLEEGQNGLSVPMIAGIAGAGSLCLLALIFFLLYRKRRKSKQS